MNISRQIKTGLIAVAALIFFIWGFNYLGGKNLFKPKVPTFFTEYTNVQGLNTASPVTINGFQVGKVQEIKFDKNPEKQGRFIVEYSMEADFEFSKNSIVRIYSEGLMGGKALAIIPDYKGEIAQSGDFLKGDIESDFLADFTDKLNPLQSKVESMIVAADSLLVGLNDMLDETTKNKIKSSVSNLDRSMANLNELTNEVNQVLVDNKEGIKNTLAGTQQVTEKIQALTDNINSEISDAQLAKTVQNLNNSVERINSIVSKLEKGDGSLGKLLQDEDLYNNLNDASNSLDLLLNDLKNNPKKYVHFSVFGKKDKCEEIED